MGQPGGTIFTVFHAAGCAHRVVKNPGEINIPFEITSVEFRLLKFTNWDTCLREVITCHKASERPMLVLQEGIPTAL